MHEEIMADDMRDVISTDDLVDELFGRVGEFGDRIAEGFKSWLAQPAVNPAAQAAARARMQARAAAERAAQARAAAAGARRSQPRRPPPPPPPVKKDDDVGEAYDVLGFPRGSKPTKEQIKARQKALAKVFHPDAGGDVAAMQRVNSAVKTLLAVVS